MNIFALSKDAKEAASWHNDRHTVKMIVEYAQLLSTAHRVLDGILVVLPMKTKTSKTTNRKVWQFDQDDPRCGIIYKATHINHPSAIWARENDQNYLWLYELWVHLINEWRSRFGHSKVHKCEALIDCLKYPPQNIPKGHLTPVALAMPDHYKISDDHVICYQEYYKLGKAHLANWRGKNAPPWFYKFDTLVP